LAVPLRITQPGDNPVSGSISQVRGYRGVGTTSEALPGIMIVLVPLPLLMSIPGTAEPGSVIICGDPGLPVTRPVPRDVVMDGVVDMDGVGVAGGATTGGGGAKDPPAGAICATAEPIAAASKAIAIQNLIILHALQTWLWIWWPKTVRPTAEPRTSIAGVIQAR
jgi:hypothetical protein